VESKHPAHPAADIFPMMNGDDFASLKQDIAEQGQKEDIVLFEGQVLDGRNRERACLELGIDPEYCELEECKDPIAFVLSHNLHRRHLTQSQRAQCAAAAAKLRRGSNQHKAQCEDGSIDLSIDAAAKAFGVSAPSVKRAKHIADKGAAEVVEAVKSGEISVNAAARLVDAVPDKKEQKKLVKAGKKAVVAAVVEAAKKPDPKPAKKPAAQTQPASSPSFCSDLDELITMHREDYDTSWAVIRSVMQNKVEWVMEQENG
jgi:ParB-like chromosome segregation protein Spo0J